MKVGFIGAGKVGITLGAYFKSNNIDLSGYYSRSEDSAKKGAAITSSDVFHGIKDVVQNSDMIFITTYDDAVVSVWNELKRHDIEGKYIISTSGSLDTDAFEGKKETGAYCFTMHPMYAFSSGNGDFKGLNKCCFTVEGNQEKMAFVVNFLEGMENRTFEISAKDKPLYHLSNVFASNLILALLSMGTELMRGSGVKTDEFLKALIPLTLVNIKNIEEKGLVNALTGPVERNDLGTVIKHFKNLPAGYINIYAVLTTELIKVAKLKNTKRDYSRISEYIDEVLSGGETFG